MTLTPAEISAFLATPVHANRDAVLERRELAVRMKLEGHTNEQIAKELGVKKSTVISDLSVMRKLLSKRRKK